ncbi:MAG: hypothetical protein ABIJ92_01300 [Candidatus Aenigmatarchaeota archaeon]
MTDDDMSHPWYTPERDGSLARYMEEHDGRVTSRLFHGLKQYQLLWDTGYLEPQISSIRLMWSHARSDEHYMVISENELEGIEAAYHGGKPGIHRPKDILIADAPPWEALDLHPHPTARKELPEGT